MGIEWYACNTYCASHQAELARTCYIPAFEAFAAELLRKLDAGDRTPPDREIVRAFRTRALETPLDAIRSKTPRTRENLNAALNRVLEASIPTPERPVYNAAASRETVATLNADTSRFLVCGSAKDSQA